MIPAAIIAKGDRAALNYLLETTPLGAFFDREDLRRAIAEDMILEQFKPFVFTALFIDEESILNAWKVQRPESYTLARRLAESELAHYANIDPALYERRLRLRLSAYRKIDVWWCGSELFIPNEALGAEPYFTITLPGYEAQPVKIGQTRSASYNSDPKRDAGALELMQVHDLVDAIERARYPLLPWPGTGEIEEWINLQAVLTVAEEFRTFSRLHKLPAFPKALIVDPSAVPEGFQTRFAADAELWSSLYALGVSPILSNPAVEYLKTKSRSISAMISDRDSLLNFLCNSINFQAGA